MQIHVNQNQLEEIEGLTMEYPYAWHHVNLKNTRVPWHWHEEVEFCYVAEGCTKVTTANRSYTFSKNQAFFVNTNVLCTMEHVETGTATILDSHLIHSVFLGGHFKSIFTTKYLDPVLMNKNLEILEIRGETPLQKKMIGLLRQAARLQQEKDNEFQTRNLFSEIWLLLLQEIQESESSRAAVKLTEQSRIQTMLSYIHQNYREKISLEDIAGSAAISKRECLRCFQSCIRKTPHEYLLDYRINTAARLLRTTELSVLEIAFQTGFSGNAYFGKVFKAALGCTPGLYRKKNKSGLR